MYIQYTYVTTHNCMYTQRSYFIQWCISRQLNVWDTSGTPSVFTCLSGIFSFLYRPSKAKGHWGANNSCCPVKVRSTSKRQRQGLRKLRLLQWSSHLSDAPSFWQRTSRHHKTCLRPRGTTSDTIKLFFETGALVWRLFGFKMGDSTCCPHRRIWQNGIANSL